LSKVITVANQKGGVGKTTTALAIVNGLSLKGYKALAVDTDPQGNLSYAMGADAGKPGVYELMRGDAAPESTVQRTGQGDIITGSPMLSKAEREFTDPGREYLLTEAIKPLADAYDYIVIDSPPQLGIIAINSLSAADDIIIPMGADMFSLQGLSQLNATITMVRKHCNPSLNIAGILITRYSSRTVHGKDFKDNINDAAQRIGASLFHTVIREGVAVREAQSRKVSLFEIPSGPTTDYLNFIDEYIERRQ